MKQSKCVTEIQPLKESKDIDAIVVLGAAVKPCGMPSHAMKRRVEHAVGLFDKGVSKNLLLSGGTGKFPPAESELMKSLALNRGVPAKAITVESRSGTTLQNAINCKKIIKKHGWTTIVLVTDPFHMTRAILSFRALGINTMESPAQGGREFTSSRKRYYCYIRECIAIPWYLLLLLRIKIKELAFSLGC